MSTPSARGSTVGITGGAWLVGVGGVLLGLQVDRNGSVSGTGWTAFAIGALLAVGAFLARARTDATRARHLDRETSGLDVALPRDGFGLLAAVASFLALAFLLSGVLVPGGPWLFVELFVLLAFVVSRRGAASAGRWLSPAMLAVLAILLLFRLWIAYQGSRNEWAVLALDVPVLSWIPLDLLEPVKRVSLGSFTPAEFGFPPAGLSFGPTAVLWALGFAACVAGLVWTQTSAYEHENDRIHALIRTLPGGLAHFVERIVPEDEWHALGLHGLPERRLARRIESIVAARMAQQKALQSAIDAGGLLAQTNPGGFAGGIYQAIVDPETARRGREGDARARADEPRGDV